MSEASQGQQLFRAAATWYGIIPIRGVWIGFKPVLLRIAIGFATVLFLVYGLPGKHPTRTLSKLVRLGSV